MIEEEIALQAEKIYFNCPRNRKQMFKEIVSYMEFLLARKNFNDSDSIVMLVDRDEWTLINPNSAEIEKSILITFIRKALIFEIKPVYLAFVERRKANLMIQVEDMTTTETMLYPIKKNGLGKGALTVEENEFFNTLPKLH